jgi:2'-5' RNA ligase
LPAEPFRTDLAKVIAELARRFNAPAFTPHVTIYSSPIEPFTDPRDILAAAGAAARPIELISTGVSFGRQFTKTLFINFQDEANLSLLSETIRMNTSKREGYALQPHLSLLYGSINEAVKRGLAAGITPPAKVLFDVVQAVRTGEVNRTREDVERWQVLAERSLG